MFQQPPYVTTGDNYRDIPYNRSLALTTDRVGHVVAPPGPLKGMAVTKMKNGKNNDVLFMPPGYNGIGDTYVGKEPVTQTRTG